MDKEEYRQKLDELTGYVKKKDFKKALDLADEIDWRRVKSLNTLNMVADVYEVNKDYERAKEILELALGRASIGHSILYRLVEVCLKLGDVDEAEKYFNEFSKTAKNDNSRCILQYKLYKAKNAPLEAQIDVLEEYREREYTERWAYELALLYSKAGDRKKCVDACDDLILWFGEGKYVLKAMELKKKYEPLSPSQEQAYERMKKSYAQTSAQTASPDDEVSTEEEDASERADSYAEVEEPKAAKNPSGLTQLNSSADEEAETVQQEETKNVARKETSAPHVQPERKESVSGGDFREKLANNFRNIFRAQDDEEDDEDNAKEVVKPVSVSKAEDADEEEPVDAAAYEDGLKIKKLQKEDLSRNVSPKFSTPAAEKHETTPDVPKSPEKKPVSNYEKGKTADFDLNAFLAETAGSFSHEIKDEDFGNESESGTEKAVKRQTSGQEKPVPTKPAARVKTSSETAQKMASATAEKPAASAKPQQAAAPAKTEEKKPAEPKNAADAIAGLAAGSTKAPDVPAAEKKEAAQTPAARTSAGTSQASAGTTAAPAPEKKKPHYIEELEVPDPEPTEDEKKSHTHTITLNTIGENTVPISIDKILSEETPEERRIRILNKAKPTRMSEEQRKIFTYFARVPGMDGQILEAINGVYQHAGERTSLHGNIAIMGARGTGKSRLAHGLVVAMCKDLGMDAAKVARITGKTLNERDPAKVVSMMSGGFLMIEDIADVNEDTLEQLNQAMEFRTDCMVLIIEDEKTRMRAFLKEHPQFASKFEKVISIPVFTNDELVTFARTYATENGCKIDDMAILALYTMIGNIQSEEEPTTISTVKKIIDNAISRATKGRRKKGRSDAEQTGKWLILHEKDFSLN